MIKKSAWIIIVLLVIAAAAAALLLNREPAAPEEPVTEDTTAQVNDALQGTDVEDVQGELEEVDEAIESL